MLLPVQGAGSGSNGQFPSLCFGDRVIQTNGRIQLDPLECITWPELHIGDCVLVVPSDGDIVLVNRQPTLVQPRGRVFWCWRHHHPANPESMLAMRIRIGPQLSFAASCAPIEALRGDYALVIPCVGASNQTKKKQKGLTRPRWRRNQFAFPSGRPWGVNLQQKKD